jgi:Dockerin type I domain
MNARAHIAILFALIFPFVSHAITVEITATVPGCGDGEVQISEDCDGNNFNDATCSSNGFSGGSLSCTNACTVDTSSCTTGSSSGGVGGGSSNSNTIAVTTANVVFIGTAPFRSTITLLKDGQFEENTPANSSGDFQITISDVSKGSYIFGLYATNSDGLKTETVTFPIEVNSKATVKVSDIFIEDVFGAALSLSESAAKSDVNDDNKINIVDFSIAAYWYKRSSPPASVDLNSDGKVDIVDFSIMAFNWTG